MKSFRMKDRSGPIRPQRNFHGEGPQAGGAGTYADDSTVRPAWFRDAHGAWQPSLNQFVEAVSAVEVAIVDVQLCTIVGGRGAAETIRAGT